jgi:hypothetical protein
MLLIPFAPYTRRRSARQVQQASLHVRDRVLSRQVADTPLELSLNFGDGLAGQAAAVMG